MPGVALRWAAFWSLTHVYPYLVSSDIGCGMELWRMEMSRRKFRPDTALRKLHKITVAGTSLEELTRRDRIPWLIAHGTGA